MKQIACVLIVITLTLLVFGGAGCTQAPMPTPGAETAVQAPATDGKASASTPIVQLADKCSVDFSCRFEDDTLLITTQQSIADDPTVPKSNAFVALQEYKPIDILAGVGSIGTIPETGYGLLQELNKRLAQGIVGLEVGRSADVPLSSQPAKDPDGNGVVRMLVMRERPIEQTIPMMEAKALLKDKEPVEGMAIEMEPSGDISADAQGLMGRVIQIEEGFVKIRLTGKPGDTFHTPYGPAQVERLRDDGIMEIRMQPSIGHVTRIKYNLATITKVDDRAFTLDANHPFAGQTLKCNVLVRSADSDSPETREYLARTQINSGTAVSANAAVEIADIVQPGDVALVHYRIKDQQGRLQSSTFPEDTAELMKQTLAGGGGDVHLQPAYPVVAGRPSEVPGLAKMILDMGIGQRKVVTVPAVEAYGERDETKIVEIARTKTVPRFTTIESELFKEQFKTRPEVGTEFQIPLYGRAKVTSISDAGVSFELAPKELKQKRDFGTVDVTVGEHDVTYLLTPTIGAPYGDQQRRGKIIKSDKDNFTVDFNSPLAGQSITLEVLVKELTKASTLSGNAIQWREDLDKAGAEARREDKSMAVVLYADWCGWCKRLFTQTLTDPIIASMGDDFVWVKLNSDKHREYKARFGQGGFPTVVLLDKEGRIIQKMEGFQQPHQLREALEQALAHEKA